MATPIKEPHDDTGDDVPAAVAPLRSPSDDAAAPRRHAGSRAAGIVRAKRTEATEWLEGARHRSTAIDVAMRLRDRDAEAAGTIAGSAVAFRLFLFFVPTLLVVVALAGFVAAHLSPGDVNHAAGLSGSMAKQIETAFSQPSTTRWTALAVGIVGMISAGRSLAKTLVLASGLSWRAPSRQSAKARVTALVIGVMVGIGLMASIVNRIRQSAGLAVAGMSLVAVVAVYTIAWGALLLSLPRVTTDPAAVLPGAALAGVVLALLQAVTQFYIPGKIDKASELYGSLGVVIVTLGWFFFIGRVTVFSMTLNAVLYERLGSLSTFVFGLPLLRLIPARSARFARYFGLDAKRSAGAEAAVPAADGVPGSSRTEDAPGEGPSIR